MHLFADLILTSEFMNSQKKITSTFKHFPGWQKDKITEFFFQKPRVRSMIGH